MTPKFLRDEAARFRQMAETTEREASKLRLLGMATDFEARAQAIDGRIVQAPVQAPDATSDEPGDVEMAAPAPVSETRLVLGKPRDSKTLVLPDIKPRRRLTKEPSGAA